MRHKTFIFVVLVSVSACIRGAVVQEGAEGLRIHLPRQVGIQQEMLILSRVAIVGGDEVLAAKAGEVVLGRLAVPGQTVVIDRPTILSRLASSSVPAGEVTFTGAESVAVSQDTRVITGEKTAEAAKAYLVQAAGDSQAVNFEPINTPQDVLLPSAKENIKFSPRLVSGPAGGQARVSVSILSDGKTLATRDVVFRLQYRCRRVVAAADIAAGELLTEANTKIETVITNRPEAAGWRAPYGCAAKREIVANTVIEQSMISAVERPVLVERNQNVVIRLDSPALSITATGKAMERGRAGDCIRIKNVDSQRMIIARVSEDGTVEPVF